MKQNSCIENIPIESLYPIISNFLKKDKSVTFTVSGISMQPMLYNRRDSVTLIPPPKKLKKYDLPFYKVDESFLLHRVIKVNEDGTYECRGDNRWESEENITHDQVIGVVKTFTRNGKVIDVDKSIGYHIYTYAWGFLHHFKKYYSIIRNTKSFFNRIKRRLKYTFRPIKKAVLLEGKYMKNIKFRPATTSDIKAVQSLFVSLVQYEKENFGIEVASKNWYLSNEGKKYFENISEKNFLWVAVLGSEVIGYASGKISKHLSNLHPIGTLINVFVKEDYRHCGVGAEFIDLFKKFCKENDCYYLNVTFQEKNSVAQKFYAKHGFGSDSKTYNCKL